MLGGFDGWESLNSVEMLDLSKQKSNFEIQENMISRVKNGVAVFNEQD